MEDVGKVVGYIVGAVALLWIIGSKLLSRYFRQGDKLEALKEKSNTRQFKELKQELYEVKATLGSIEKKIIALDGKIGSNEESSKKVLKSLETFVESTDKRFRSIEQSEIINLGGGKYMLKTKNG